jgi:hypothetical protein
MNYLATVTITLVRPSAGVSVVIVTDNGTNTLYFYMIDKDKPINNAA